MIQFTYFNAATEKMDATSPEPFTVDGLTNAMKFLTSNLGEDDKIVGAEVVRAGALPASVPERIAGGADAETHILRLVVAAAPQRSPFDPGEPDSGNPRRNNVVSIVDAFDAGVDDVSSGLYFSLAATAAPASFEVLRQLLATYLEYESNYTAKSSKRAAALLGVPADHADVVLRGGSAARLVSAAFASACTCPAAYAASTGVDSAWIRAVVQQLRRTLLPLVNADRFTSTPGKTQTPPGRKNSGLADACFKSGVKSGSLYSVLRNVIAKINAAAGDPPGTAVDDFFAGDNAPLYCVSDSDNAVDSSVRTLLTKKPLDTTSLADVLTFSHKPRAGLREVTLTLNGDTYTGSIDSADAEANFEIKIDPRPRDSTNADAFIQDDATAYEVNTTDANVSVKQQHKLADGTPPQSFVLRYTLVQSLIAQAAEAFVLKHGQLMATLSNYLEDLVRAKMQRTAE